MDVRYERMVSFLLREEFGWKWKEIQLWLKNNGTTIQTATLRKWYSRDIQEYRRHYFLSTLRTASLIIGKLLYRYDAHRDEGLPFRPPKH